MFTSAKKCLVSLAVATLLVLPMAVHTPPAAASGPGWSTMPAGQRLTDGLMIYDPDHELLVAYGGRDKFVNKSSDASDLLSVFEVAYEDGQWLEASSRASGIKPPALHSSAGIYWPTLQQMVLYAGSGNGDDVVALDLAAGLKGLRWLRPRVIGAAGNRANHSAVYVPELDEMVVFGGNKKNARNARDTLNDTWTLERSGAGFMWRPVETGPAPAPRFDHSAIYDPVNHWMIVYGGTETAPAPAYGDLWALDFTEAVAPRWIDLGARLAETSPGARKGHTAVYDPVRQRMVVYGGSGATAKQVWALELAGGLDALRWTLLDDGTTPGALPARSSHTAAWVTSQDCMVVFQGSARFSELGDTWMFHPVDSTGHHYLPRLSPTCDASVPGSVCGAQLSVRVFVDYRCDSVYNPGFDQLLAGAKVAVTVPALGQTLTAQTDGDGVVHFQGLDVPVGQPLTVTVDAGNDGEYGWCGHPDGSAVIAGDTFNAGRAGFLTVGLRPVR